MNEECCANCRYNYKLVKFDYSQGGCIHTDMDGYACTMPENKDCVIWMYGDNPNTGRCECWKERE